MNFIFAGYALTSATNRASNISIAGNRVVDEVDAVLSASKKYFARGNRSTPISFETSIGFASLKAAELFILLHNTQLPEVGTLEVVCGQPGDTQSVYFAGAALQAIPQLSQGGVRVAVSYQFACGLGTTTILPDLPTPTATPDPMILRNETAIAEGASQVDIVWPTQAVPPTSVSVNLVIPDSAGSIIGIVEQRDQRTASGTRFLLAAATPAAGYKASWVAVF